MSTEMIPFDDLQRMGQAVAKSGLFGMRKPEEAIALMLIAQSEGRHPATAAKDYHIIQGRPSLKADAMLARFQEAGGTIEWHEMTDAKADATFTHAKGGSIRLDWDMDRAKQAGLSTGKDNWKKYPRAMLKSRVITDGVRAVFPGVCTGFYSTEEAAEMEPYKKPREWLTRKESEEKQGEVKKVEATIVESPLDEAREFFKRMIAEEKLGDFMDDEEKASTGGMNEKELLELLNDLRFKAAGKSAGDDS